MSAPVTFLDGRVTLYLGDCREAIAGLPDALVDSVVTDPPYHLTGVKGGGAGAIDPSSRGQTSSPYAAKAGFMGKAWDGGSIAFDPALWTEVLRVLKPGGHMVAFSGTRTYHRMVCAIEDAGFEIRDQIGWVFGSGFPKSHDVSKGIDKAVGAVREVVGSYEVPGYAKSNVEHGAQRRTKYQFDKPSNEAVTDEAARWQGWGTALKPAWESICLARKPLIGTVAENVLAHGTGALNIDASRVETDSRPLRVGDYKETANNVYEGRLDGSLMGGSKAVGETSLGRWPANLVHDGSEEVLAAFPEAEGGGNINGGRDPGYGGGWKTVAKPGMGDSGSAARFFYTAKADSDDRIGSKHPTVKPVDLMRWLCRLITPPGGTILDCFAGTGTTAEAAYYEGFSCILIEREAEYQADIERRMRLIMAGPDERSRESIKARQNGKPQDDGPLFAWQGGF